jgi:UDP-N-acetylglucosamine 2-epimerase (non-hydrolysing)
MPKKRVALVVGTRPEAIKIAPVYFALRQSNSIEPILLATAQHREMLDQTLSAFGLSPDADLDLMQPGQLLPDLTGRVITAVSDWLSSNPVDAVLVQGDTTTVLGTAMAAFYQHIPIGHVEAGLRTGTIESPFPEEMNRRLTSPIARWHFCPTAVSKSNLLKESICESKIHVTGNTVVDALLWMRNYLSSDDAAICDGFLDDLHISQTFREQFIERPDAKWILVTGHRRESFGEGFRNICKAIRTLVDTHSDVGVLYPVHLNPNVRQPVQELLSNHPRIDLIEPASYRPFVYLMDRCTFLLTDSGGVQEEAPSLGKPVLVMRESTERPEAVDAGTCRLVGTDIDTILKEASVLLTNSNEYDRRSKLNNPYGDGRASMRIREILEREL